MSVTYTYSFLFVDFSKNVIIDYSISRGVSDVHNILDQNKFISFYDDQCLALIQIDRSYLLPKIEIIDYISDSRVAAENNIIEPLEYENFLASLDTQLFKRWRILSRYQRLSLSDLEANKELIIISLCKLPENLDAIQLQQLSNIELLRRIKVYLNRLNDVSYFISYIGAILKYAVRMKHRFHILLEIS